MYAFAPHKIKLRQIEVIIMINYKNVVFTSWQWWSSER